MERREAGEIAAQDEILQVMYWLRGERLADSVTVRDLERWLGLEPAAIGSLLARLEAKGLVERAAGADEDPRYALTGAGALEGGRRFADEFADVTRPGHGECGDPDCECQRTGNPADCLHAASSGG